MNVLNFSHKSLVGLLALALALPLQAQWAAGSSGTANDLNTTWRIGTDVVLIGGVNGTLLRSTDAGATFSPAGGGFFDDVNEMQFVDDLQGYAVADNGRFLSSTDAGATWSVSFLPTGSNLSGLHFRDAANGHVVGRDGVIFRTVDGGSSWTAQASGTTERLESVYFTDANTGYIAGRNDTYLSTTDGGASWTLGTLLGTGRDLNDVFFTDANTGYMATDNGILARTTDAGATWSTSFTGTVQNLNEVYFLDASNGYMAGDGGVILASTDGGASWTAEASGTTANLEDIHFSAMGQGAAAGAAGTVVVLNTAAPCTIPVGGLSAVIGATGVSFSWEAQSAATGYQVQGAAVGGVPRKANLSTNSFFRGGGAFTPGATYNWRVRAVCGTSFGPYSGVESFTIPVVRKMETRFQVFPNPTQDFVQVDLPEDAQTLDLISMQGQILRSRSVQGLATLTLDLRELPSGMYAAVVRTSAGQERHLVQRQ